MPASCPTVFRQRVCRFPSCLAVFYLCRHCDRGQRYCSPRCREKSRRQKRHEANRRHQQSPEGRLDHRDRQHAYRQRRRKQGVTDQGSLRGFPHARMAVSEPQPPTPAAGVSESPLAVPVSGDFGGVVCQICGRRGRFVNPFHVLR